MIKHLFRPKLITIVFTPHNLICAWIEPSHGHTPLILRAYERFPCVNLELEHSILFNPSIIKKYITQFIHRHALEKAYVSFSIAGPSCKEYVMKHHHASPHFAEFNLEKQPHWYWEYRYLYPHDDGTFMFYVCGLPAPIILQYQLLAHALHLNLITLTTRSMSLFTLYRFMYGAAFRKGQLAVHMAQREQNPERLFSQDSLHRILTMPSSFPIEKEKEFSFLLHACGLFVTEETFYEKN